MFLVTVSSSADDRDTSDRRSPGASVSGTAADGTDRRILISWRLQYIHAIARRQPATPATLDLIATSAFGLEAVVARELNRWATRRRSSSPAGCSFTATSPISAARTSGSAPPTACSCGWAPFPARDFGQLFDGTRALPWEEWLPADAEFPVTGRSVKSQLSSVPACQKIVKKAVVERLKAAYGMEWFAETGPKYSLEIALLDNQATLTIDTSGPGLHKRGYRPLTGNAPLKETMAAAMVMLSVWRPDRPLIDPFCGSGTIPIEAALIGRNMAPGIARTLRRRVLAAAAGRTLGDGPARRPARRRGPNLPQRIIGTDVDEGVLGLARFHAEKAGVAADIHFQQRPFSELASKRPYGCVICNPPYGERLGESAEALALHRAMPDVFRRLKTWSFFILTALPDFEAVIGQPATRRRKLYNGRIECTYYQFLGPKPGSGEGAGSEGAESEIESESRGPESGTAETRCGPIRGSVEPESVVVPTISLAPAPSSLLPASAPRSPAPVFGGLSAKAREQAEIFRARLTKRARHLRRWPTKLGITCYRLYEHDIPEVPLVVDRYEDCLHIAEFARPTEHTPAEHADWLDLMLRTAAEVHGSAGGERFSQAPRAAAGHGAIRAARRPAADDHRPRRRPAVRGESLRIISTPGLFLDHRITRGMVRAAAAGKRFLNLFAYTGSFSVYAAAGGAAETVTVDLSNTYLDWAGRNMALNGFTGPDHEFVRDDAMQFLRKPPRPRRPSTWPSSTPPPFPTARPGGLLGHPAEPRRRCSIGWPS